MTFMLSHSHGATTTRQHATNIAAAVQTKQRASGSVSKTREIAKARLKGNARPKFPAHVQTLHPVSPAIHEGNQRNPDEAEKNPVTAKIQNVAGMTAQATKTRISEPGLPGDGTEIPAGAAAVETRWPSARCGKGSAVPARHVINRESRTMLRKRNAWILKSGMEA